MLAQRVRRRSFSGDEHGSEAIRWPKDGGAGDVAFLLPETLACHGGWMLLPG
jgi:hypothetical protein